MHIAIFASPPYCNSGPNATIRQVVDAAMGATPITASPNGRVEAVRVPNRHMEWLQDNMNELRDVMNGRCVDDLCVTETKGASSETTVLPGNMIALCLEYHRAII